VRESIGRRFLDQPGETTDDLKVVLYAYRAKYGQEVFRRYTHFRTLPFPFSHRQLNSETRSR